MTKKYNFADYIKEEIEINVNGEEYVLRTPSGRVAQEYIRGMAQCIEVRADGSSGDSPLNTEKALEIRCQLAANSIYKKGETTKPIGVDEFLSWPNGLVDDLTDEAESMVEMASEDEAKN